MAARARAWGPHAGTVGALLAALGYAVSALAPPTLSLAVGLPLLLVLGARPVCVCARVCSICRPRRHHTCAARSSDCSTS